MSSPRTFLWAMIMQGGCNSKAGKHSFTGLNAAEPKLIICNDIANEWKESLLFYFPSAAISYAKVR